MPLGPRRHLAELEDQPWFPAWLRDPVTDFPGLMARLSRRGYAPFVDKLAAALETAHAPRLVDLDSGNGAAAIVVTEEVNRRRLTPIPLALTEMVERTPLAVLGVFLGLFVLLVATLDEQSSRLSVSCWSYV